MLKQGVFYVGMGHVDITVNGTLRASNLFNSMHVIDSYKYYTSKWQLGYQKASNSIGNKGQVLSSTNKKPIASSIIS